MYFWQVILSLLMLSACVSNEHSFSDKVSFEPIVEAQDPEAVPVKFIMEQGVEKVGSQQAVEWYTCSLGSEHSSFVLLNPPNTVFTSSNACRYPVAAAMLAQGINVLAINRPGHGKSTGKDQWGDAIEVKNDASLLAKIRDKGIKISGLWAFGEASLAAFQLAKLYPFESLIIGNGIYDWEQSLKQVQDPDFKSRMLQLQGTAEGTFAEQRSIAWDFSGLPKKILLYHNNGNICIPAAQASAFKASLAASEYKVELFLLEGQGCDLDAPHHRGLMQKILPRLSSSSDPSS